ncbi:hypothetical protein GYB22_03665 [bacterium]|nr:hypothetical protein [bacterium]
MFKKGAILLFILSTYSLSAQTPAYELQWGPVFESPRGSYISKVLDMDSVGLYAQRQDPGVFSVNHYLEHFVNLDIRRVVQQFKDKMHDEQITEILKLGTDVWQLTYRGDYEQKELKAQIIDEKTLKPSGDMVDIYNIQLFRKLRYTRGSIFYKASNDNNSIVFALEEPGDYEEKAQLTIQVRDELFYHSFTDTMHLPYSKDRVDLEYVDITNEKEIICLIKVYEPGNLIEEHRGDEYTYELWVINTKHEQRQVELKLDDQEIRSVQVEPNEEGAFVCAGFYSRTLGTAEGIYYRKYSIEDLELKVHNTQPFSMELLQQGKSEKEVNRIKRKAGRGKSVGIQSIRVKDFKLDSEGKLLMVGEYLDMNVPQVGNQQASSAASYIFRDILLVSIDSTGEILWSKKILKRQITTDDAGFMSGYALFTSQKGGHILFNDNEENLTINNYDDLKTWTRKKRCSSVFIVSFDNEGNLNKEELLKYEDIKMEFIPQSSIQISEKELLLVFYKRKENRLAKLVFK